MTLCCWKQFYASWDRSVQHEVLLCDWKGFLCKLGRICETGNALIQLGTILCKFGQISATGNASMQLKNNIIRVWTDLCVRKCSYRLTWSGFKTIVYHNWCLNRNWFISNWKSCDANNQTRTLLLVLYIWARASTNVRFRMILRYENWFL